MSTDNYKKAEELLIKLHELMVQESKIKKQLHENEIQQDLIRDEMDLPVRSLSPEEDKNLREKSEQLYAQNERIENASS